MIVGARAVQCSCSLLEPISLTEEQKKNNINKAVYSLNKIPKFINDVLNSVAR